jgi:hypothetical protein
LTADVFDGCEVVAVLTGGSVADGKGGNDWSSIWNTTGSGLAEWNGLMAEVNVGDGELLQTLTDFELGGFDVTASDL